MAEQGKPCDICKENKCYNKEKGFQFSSQQASLGETLWMQQKNGRHCDLNLIVGEKTISAHRCVLAAGSSYFDALLSENFCDHKSRDYSIPTTPQDCIDNILEYLYLGTIKFPPEQLESVFTMADFLCISELRQFCKEATIQSVSCVTWISILEFSLKFSLNEVQEGVLEYIFPLADDLLPDNDDVLQLSPEAIQLLFRDHRTNYISEHKLVELLIKWFKYNPNKKRFAFTVNLFKDLDPMYLTKSTILDMIDNPEFAAYFDDNLRESYQRRLDRHMNQVLLCRSRSNTLTDIQLMLYKIEEDEWIQLNCPPTLNLNGLETMAINNESVYFMASKLDDFCGYMHSAKETKQFFSLNFRTGEWNELPPPYKVTQQCHLISHINGLFVMDKLGIIEMFDQMTSCWFDVGKPIFTTIPAATMHFLPMPMDRYIYVLRISNLGYSPEFAEFTLEIHIYDTINGTNRLLSTRDSSELDLDPEERFYNYCIVPGKILLKDSIGQTRVEYNITSQSWETNEVNQHVAKCFGAVWGSVQCLDKCYIVTNSPNKQYFLQYDWNKRRLKALSKPPCQISGLICCLPNLTLPSIS